MLERLCRLQAYVRQVLCNGLIVKATSSAHLELKDNHWALIQTLVEKLKPIKIATDYLEGEKYVSISGVIPLVKGLSQKYMPCEEDSRSLALFKNKILTQLHERFGFVFNQNSCYIHMSIATWLDPRYKTSYFKKVDGIQIKGSIESEMIAIKQRQTNANSKDIDNCFEKQFDFAKKPESLDELLGCGIESHDSSKEIDEGNDDEVASVSEETASYLKTKIQTTNLNTLEWWKSNTATPVLKELAVKYSCMPATSASSERSFSSAGLTASKLRSRLTGKHVEMLNVLHCNKKFCM
uniref:uncharacterized protein LOC120330652 n=1 Tax=Styela clava TaxID=7725 RepID=UPI00193A437E|nr:uncharacterized protein LOC120330652 [Styela clava]